MRCIDVLGLNARAAAALALALIAAALAAPAPALAQTVRAVPGAAAAPGSTSVAPAASPAPAGPAALAASPSGSMADAPAGGEPGPRVLLIPQRETTLVAQILARVDRLGGELGSAFREGQPLVEFDCVEHQARLKMSDAEFNSAREQLDAKKRLQKLDAAGEVEVALAAAAVEKARAQTDLSKAQLRQCTVYAPFAGRIVKLHVRQYQGVNVGQPLMEIVSSGPLKVRLNAPSKWLSWVKPGTAFEVRIDETGRSYPAVVSAINGRVDAVSQSVEIEGRVNGAYADLLAGMSGIARFAQAR